MLDGMGVGLLHALTPHQGGDKHEQGRFGQMEVRHQTINGFELITRCDEDIRVTTEAG